MFLKLANFKRICNAILPIAYINDRQLQPNWQKYQMILNM